VRVSVRVRERGCLVRVTLWGVLPLPPSLSLLLPSLRLPGVLAFVQQSLSLPLCDPVHHSHPFPTAPAPTLSFWTGVLFLRIPRSCTADPAHDFSGEGGSQNAPGRSVEDAEVRRQRTERFQMHILLVLSRQRALKAEDVFTENEAKAYLRLHDYDLAKAVDAMKQDQEWDDKYGKAIRARWKQMESERAATMTAAAAAKAAAPAAAAAAADPPTLPVAERLPGGSNRSPTWSMVEMAHVKAQ
jgi:hypothetical protein